MWSEAPHITRPRSRRSCNSSPELRRRLAWSSRFAELAAWLAARTYSAGRHTCGFSGCFYFVLFSRKIHLIYHIYRANLRDLWRAVNASFQLYFGKFLWIFSLGDNRLKLKDCHWCRICICDCVSEATHAMGYRPIPGRSSPYPYRQWWVERKLRSNGFKMDLNFLFSFETHFDEAVILPISFASTLLVFTRWTVQDELESFTKD